MRLRLAVVFALIVAGCAAEPVEPDSAPAAAPAPAPTPMPPPTPPPATPPEADSKPELSCVSVGVSKDELPIRWNAFVDAVGFGFKLPEALTASGTVLGLNEFTQYLDASRSAFFAVNVYWDPDSDQVREVTIFGPVSDETTSIALTGTAGAMVFATTSLTPMEAENFLVQRLMTGVETLRPGGFISELVEEDGRAFRFTLAGDGADWSVVGNLPCP